MYQEKNDDDDINLSFGAKGRGALIEETAILSPKSESQVDQESCANQCFRFLKYNQGVKYLAALVLVGIIILATLGTGGGKNGEKWPSIYIGDVLVHLNALQEAAAGFPQGSRSIGIGFGSSYNYVYSQLTAEDELLVSYQDFVVDVWELADEPTLSLLTGNTMLPFMYGEEFQELSYSGSGYVNSSVTAIPNGGCKYASVIFHIPLTIFILDFCSFFHFFCYFY